MFSVGILIYPQVEVLDFCGPFEVFRNVQQFQQESNVEVFTVSASKDPVDAQGLHVLPSYAFDTCPQLDLLVIPGGAGQWLIEQQDYLDFIESQNSDVKYLLTVCTGALVVGKLGILTPHMTATTHQVGIDLLSQLVPGVSILPYARFTHNDNLVMTGGISAGIDGALYLVSQIWGMQTADDIALYMEYDWTIRAPEIEDPALKSLER